MKTIFISSRRTTFLDCASLDKDSLDLQASNFSKWRNFLLIVVTQFALADHLDLVPPPADAKWLQMDSTVLRWLYGTINPDLIDMVMPAGTTAAAVFAGLTSLFRDNQQARAGYLTRSSATSSKETRASPPTASSKRRSPTR